MPRNSTLTQKLILATMSFEVSLLELCCQNQARMAVDVTFWFPVYQPISSEMAHDLILIRFLRIMFINYEINIKG